MRFVLDEDVDAKAVGSFLRRRRHECWTVVEAGLGGADDDAVAICADDRGAILVTHDAEATRRRRKFTFGRHVFLRCHQLEAVELVEQHIAELEHELERHHMGVVEVRDEEITKGCNPPMNDRFCPDPYVTREQMAAFLHRADGFR